MTRITREVDADDDLRARVLEPRRALVLEREVAPGVFEAERGPVEGYRRVVETLDGGRLRQTVEYRLAIPYFAPLFWLPVRARLGSVHASSSRTPWWSPPDTLDVRAARSLGGLAILTVVTGYLATLLTQTITFAASEFDADKSEQGVALAAARFDVILAVALVSLADRRGRRAILLLGIGVGALVTVTGAVVPGIAWLAASQVVARGFLTAGAIVSGVMAAEEMPANSRAYAISILSMAGALGAGLAVALLPLADLGDAAWRILYAVPIVFLPLLVHVARHLPESRRFNAPHADATLRSHGWRFWLLAVSALLLALFTTPASQFQNEYLRTERDFSAARIALFTIATNTPGALGIIIGGRLADVQGRRIVGAVALVGGVGATVLMYVTAGAALWVWSVIGAVIGAAAVPALGVYGPELFPTSLRGKANGIIVALGRVGGVVGLLAAGFLADAIGTTGPALALLAIGPFALAVLVLTAYPETAHRELEELNPEDLPPVPDAARP